MSKHLIAGRTALVTGATRGIGLAVTRALLERGAAKVYAGARRTEDLAELAKEFGDRLVPVTLDVTSDEQVRAAAALATDVDLLINNAGIAEVGLDVFESPNLIEAGRREFDVNFFGTYRMTEAFLPVLTGNGAGAIANVVSVAGLVAFPIFASYSASKAALHSLTQTTRMATPDNIQVHGIYPGPVDTDMTTDAPFEDMATPASVADAILDGIANGVEEIFTDPMAREMGGLFQSDPKALEGQVTAMVREMAGA